MSKTSRLVTAAVTLMVVVGAVYWYLQSSETKSEINTEDISTTATPISLENDSTGTSSPLSKMSKQITEDFANKSGDFGIDCPASPNWFPHSKTQRTNDAQFASSSNCEFHQWAWQNFLWLTQDVNGQPRFMSFSTPESLLGVERAGMLPRMTKSDTAESFDEFLQAGTDGIFVAHNNRAVYYSQYLDDTFVGFVKDNNLTSPDDLRALIAANPATNFPIVGTSGSMEIKASWMLVESGDDASDMFTTQTEVAKLINKNGQIAVDPNSIEQVTVALVGFHIAGIVKGHPEMIWATFEHHRNAPNVTPGMKLEDPVSDQDFTFYQANTELADCNVNLASSNELTLDESTQKLTPVTQVCRQYEFGNQQGVNTTNDKNIASINDSVAPLFDESDVWKNYREVGAVWFKGTDTHGTFKPGLSLQTDALLSGSLSLSNSTIETFTQVASAENNCFRCHNTLQEFPPQPELKPLPASNLNISHALKNIYFWSQENQQPTSQTSGEQP